MPPAVKDSKNIQLYLVENYGPDKADDWENGFLNDFLQGLSKVPHHKIVRSVTEDSPFPCGVSPIAPPRKVQAILSTSILKNSRYQTQNPKKISLPVSCVSSELPRHLYRL